MSGAQAEAVTLRSLVWVAASLLASGCLVTETGNPSARMSIVGRTTDETFQSIGPDGVIRSAWVALDSGRFVPSDQCASPDVADQVEGPLIVDLLAGRDVSFEVAESGDYCRLELRHGIASAPLPVGAPPELEGATLRIEGVTVFDAPFVVTFRGAFTENLDGNLGMPFRIGDGDDDAFILAYDFVDVFEDVDLGAAEVSPDGVLRIDADNNADLLAIVADNLGAAATLFSDANEDGVLSDEEAAVTLAKRP